MRSKVAVAKWGPDNVRLDVLLNLPKLETWRREHVPPGTPAFDDRRQLYDHLQRTVIGDEPIDFLEFGVYRGDSLRYWCALNSHPDSRFIGFDSFKGLPEDWKRFDGQMTAATFDVDGRAPDIDDLRVEFVRGWFQDTLGGFLATYAPKSRVVLHVDCDLYSSALYTLTRCDDILRPGSIVVFDEFSSVLHEFAALRDYCAAYRRRYTVLASAYTYYGHLAIRME